MFVVVHRGAEILIIIYGMLVAFLMNILTVEIFEGRVFHPARGAERY